MSVKQAKNIFKQFNMKSGRIICQLLIKQNELFHFTDITCETHVLNEKDQTNNTNKRSANTTDSDEEDERPSTSKSKSTKRTKPLS